MVLGIQGSALCKRERAGATLLLFALLVFGLMAIAALSIDLGFARLSQAQMQNAVDGAALEGMRWRNTLANGQPDFIEPIPTFTENNRRRRARDHVRLVFDDDMDLSTRDQGAFGTGGRFAAGPDLRIEAGLGALAARAKVSVPIDSITDDPILALNVVGTHYNADEGDMISDEFDFDAPHGEGKTYARADFTRHAFVTPAADGGAFLVRMRRSHDPDGLDRVAATSAGLPGVPLLFGMGSLARAENADRWDSRRDGLTVRATAIATARRAIAVGRPVPGLAFGVVPFALRLDLWNALPVTINDPECVRVLADGSLSWGGLVIGTFCEETLRIGDEVIPRPAGSYALPLEGWVAIYELIGGRQRVVGFGFVDFEAPIGCPPGEVSLSKRPSAVALHNASASWPRGSAVLDPSLLEVLLARSALIDQPLLAPALSR